MFTPEEFETRTNWKMSYAEYVACACERCNRKAYRTEDAARRAAAEMGLTVSVVGDLWQILHATH